LETKERLAEFERRNKEKDDINKKLQDKIEESKEIPAAVKNQLEELIKKYQNIDTDVTTELITASSLIEIKSYTKAITILIKIIENLLKEKYSKDKSFIDKMIKKGKKYPALIDYIEYAKEKKLLTVEEYHFANGLREIRNEETHELNPKQSQFMTSSAFLSAIGIILKICSKINRLKISVTA
jgi:uncharacterized coiled-coil protein SlyX